MAIECDGHGDVNGDHCCYLGPYGVCPHLVINENAVLPDRKYSCGLLVREGDWQSVYQTAEYQADVQPFFDFMVQRNGIKWEGKGCGDWPIQEELDAAIADHAQGIHTRCNGMCCYQRKMMESDQ